MTFLFVRVHVSLMASLSWQHVDLASHVEDTYGFDINAYSSDVWTVLFIGLFVRVVGCIVMWAVDSKKKV